MDDNNNNGYIPIGAEPGSGKNADDAAAKETQKSLAELRLEMEEGNRYEIEGLSFAKTQLDVLKTVAKTMLSIEAIMLTQLRNESRRVEKIDESTDPVVPEELDNITNVRALDLDVPSNLKEALGGLAGIVVAFAAEWEKVFAGITKFIKEDKLLMAIGRAFGRLGEMFKAEGIIGKLFQPGSKLVKGIIAPIEKMFASFAGLFKAEGAIAKLFTAEVAVGRISISIADMYAALAKTFVEIGTAIKATVAESRIVTTFTEAWAGLTKVFKGFSEGIALGAGPIGKFFKPLGEFFAKFKVVGTFLGETVGKLLPPLLLIMEVVEVVKGAFEFASDEMESGGNFIQVGVAAIIGGFTGFVNFWLEIPDFLLKGISKLTSMIFGPDNPVTKFLDSFSLVDLFTEFMVGVKDFVNHPLDSMLEIVETIEKSFSGLIQDAVDGILAFDFTTIFKDPVGTVISVVMAPYTLLKNAVAWVLSKLGFEEVGESLREFSITDAIKSLINKPFQLLIEASNWVMDKLGFQALITEADDFDIFEILGDLLMAPFNLLIKAVDWTLEKLGFDKLSSYLPDPAEMLQKFGDWLTGIIDAGIQWIKDKLSFFGGDSDDKKAREEAKALRKGAEADGIVTKESTGLFSSKKVIDQDTLQNMTDNQLGEFAKAYADDDDLFPLLQAEAERRKMERSKPPAKNPGTVQSALQPDAVAVVENDYANPAAVISAPEQPAVSRSQEMMMSQAQLDNTKTKQSGGGNTSVTAANTTVSTSNVTNNSYTSMPMPSTKDTSDQTYIFRATGTSR